MVVKVEHVENRDSEEGIFVGEIEKTGLSDDSEVGVFNKFGGELFLLTVS